MKLLDALKPATEFLTQSGIEDPSLNAELIVFHATGIDRLAAYRDNPDITEEQSNIINRFLKRRAQGEPVQYITGSVDFLGLMVSVGRGVLIPRPETELLVEKAITEVRSRKKSHKDSSSFRILDLCSGSGCVSLALARAFPDATVYSTEISRTALDYAVKNAKANHIVNTVFLHGSLFEPVERQLTFDLIISNPPYIKTADMKDLQPEIKDWEPCEALDGGTNGLDFYRLIFKDAPLFLKQSGKVMLEIGCHQAVAVKEIAKKSGFQFFSTHKDLAGIERIVIAER
ncbi:MAG: peptide chain release factor N(5)-glutamine methyltransferase [Nitrospiraceae bacterium]|jgi:release factor glutamine methyltransferase|nr:MAG: peptide chain release factor N(5)-glutamine methyltransferase [Nitrospiraceae bacterium]